MDTIQFPDRGTGKDIIARFAEGLQALKWHPCDEDVAITMERSMNHAAVPVCLAEYDIASLYMVSVYCFDTSECARRTGAAARVGRRRRERCILLAGAAGELAGARQAMPSSAFTFSDV